MVRNLPRRRKYFAVGDVMIKNNIYIVEEDKIILSNLSDALDIIADIGFSQGLNKIVFYLKNVNEELFDLKNGILGEILQKYTNYNFSAAFVGDFTKFKSKSLNDFIFEMNKGNRFIFTDNLDFAIEKLS